MKKQLFFATLAFAGITQASDPARVPFYRVDQHAANAIAGVWNSPHRQTVQDIATLACAAKPDYVAKVAANATERAITANGKFNTPNAWDGTDGNGGVKAWLPLAITVGSFGRLAWRWHNVQTASQTKAVEDANVVTNAKFDTVANSWAQNNNIVSNQRLDQWAQKNAIVKDNKLQELTAAAGFVQQDDIADMASKSWVGDQNFATANHKHDDMATQEWVTAKFAQVDHNHDNAYAAKDAIADMASKSWVGDQKFAKADHQHKGMATQQWATAQFAKADHKHQDS